HGGLDELVPLDPGGEEEAAGHPGDAAGPGGAAAGVPVRAALRARDDRVQSGLSAAARGGAGTLGGLPSVLDRGGMMQQSSDIVMDVRGLSKHFHVGGGGPFGLGGEARYVHAVDDVSFTL